MADDKKQRREKVKFDLQKMNEMQERLVKTAVEIAEEYRGLHEDYSVSRLNELLALPEPLLEASHVKSPFDDLLAKIATEKVSQNFGKSIGYEKSDIKIPLGLRVENALVDNRVYLPNIDALTKGNEDKTIPGLVKNDSGQFEVATGIHFGPVDGNKNLRDKIKELLRDIEELGAANIDPLNYLPQSCITLAWIDFLHPERPLVTAVYDLSRKDGGIVSSREVNDEYETFRGIGLQRLSRTQTLNRFDLIAEPTMFIADFQHHYRDLFAGIEKHVRAYASKKNMTIDPERGTPSSTYYLRSLLTGVKYIAYFDARADVKIDQLNGPRLYDNLLADQGIEEDKHEYSKSQYRYAVLKLSNILHIVPCLLGAGLEVKSARNNRWGDFGVDNNDIDFRDPRQNVDITIAAGHPKYFGGEEGHDFNLFDATIPALHEGQVYLSKITNGPAEFAEIATPQGK